MKKIFLLCTCLLFLCGCGKSDKLPELRAKYTDAPEMSFTYDVICDFGAVITYTCEYSVGQEGEKCTIIAPEEVAGISTSMSEDGMSVEFDGMSLITYTPSIDGFSPADCMFYLIRDIKSAEPESYTFDKNSAVLTYEDKETTKIVTFAPDTYEIVSAELFVKEDMVLSILRK